MCDNETPDHKESGTDRECIDAIPRRASVVGIDTDGRAHLSSIYGELEIWVVDETGTECVHYANGGDRELSSWVEFVEDKCGWDVRHRVELPAGAGLFDDEALPPTRSEVLNA
jgi:hypothetical protein